MKVSTKTAIILIFIFSCDSIVENNESESPEYNLSGLWIKDSVKAEYTEGCNEIGFHPSGNLFAGNYEFFSGCFPLQSNEDPNPECYNNYSDSTITESCFSILFGEGNVFSPSEMSSNLVDSCSILKILITDNNIYNYNKYIHEYNHNGEIGPEHIDAVWWSSNNIYIYDEINKGRTINFLSPDTLLIVDEYDGSSFGDIEVDAPSLEFYLILDLSENDLEISRSFTHNECDVKYTHSFSRDLIISYDVLIRPDIQIIMDNLVGDYIDWGIPEGCGLLTTLDVFQGNPLNISSAIALPDVLEWVQMDPPDFDLWVEESTPIPFSIYNSYPVQDGCDLPENHLYLSGNNILYNS